MDLDLNITQINHFCKYKICKNLNKSKPEFTLGIFPDLKKAGFKPGVVANTWFKFHIF